MIFSIDRDVLLNQLLIVQKGLPSKTPFPVLNAIKIEVEEDYILFTSSNSDVSIQVHLEDKTLNVIQPGKVAVSGKYFIEIIKRVNANRVEIALIEDRLMVIKADKSEFKLHLIDYDDYPAIDFLDLDDPILIDSKIVKEIIKETNFATANTEKRPILTGVNLRYKDNGLFCVATDSYRLAQKNVKLRTHSKLFDIVIPNKSLDELIKIIDNLNSDIELFVNPNKVLFKIDHILFQTRLLEGTYPDTERIIPVEYPVVIQFNKEELLGAVERVSLLSPKEASHNLNIIKLYLRDDKVVEVSSTSNEIGDALEEVIPTGDVVGSGIKIAFSAKYLIESLKSFNSQEVIINFAGEVRPFVIKGNLDQDLLHLILPVRID